MANVSLGDDPSESDLGTWADAQAARVWQSLAVPATMDAFSSAVTVRDRRMRRAKLGNKVASRIEDRIEEVLAPYETMDLIHRNAEPVIDGDRQIPIVEFVAREKQATLVRALWARDQMLSAARALKEMNGWDLAELWDVLQELYTVIWLALVSRHAWATLDGFLHSLEDAAEAEHRAATGLSIGSGPPGQAVTRSPLVLHGPPAGLSVSYVALVMAA